MSSGFRRVLLLGVGAFVAAFAAMYVIAPPLGAPIADSVTYEAARILSDKPESWKKAAEVLTVGLSATQ